MISRRDLLKTGSAALASLAVMRSPWQRLADRPAQGEDLTRYVDPFIGTGAHGHTYPGAQLPFGMVQLSPDNGVNGWDWSAGYHWSSERIAGFSHTHLSGTGIGDMYDILFMPTFTSGPPLRAVGSRFTHARERAEPGYYSVDLLDTEIAVELSCTRRVGIHRYAFPRSSPRRYPSVTVNLGHSLNWDRPTDTFIAVESPTLISGYRKSTGWAPDHHVYFAASFSRPFTSHWLESEWADPAAHRELKGERVKGCFQFMPGPAQRIVVKVGISPVSIEGARRNLRREASSWDFDAYRRAATAAWNAELARIRVPAANARQQTLLYTALYHALLAPQLFCDVDGAYRGPDGRVHASRTFANHTVFSLWDTFRAEHPLLTIVQPERVNDLIQSMFAFYREGGLLPVWPLAGNETDTMIGYHSVPVILDAWSKGLASIEPQEALTAMKKSATQDGHGLRFYGTPDPRPVSAFEEEQTRSAVERIGSVGWDDLRRLGRLVNGFDHAIAGEVIDYHSAYLNARSALLVRTQDSSTPIEWETGPVPERAAGRELSFVWLAGLDATEDRKRFELWVDGERWVRFRSPRADDGGFRESGRGDSRLTFKPTHVDRHGDLFGFMFLTLPKGPPAGKRLRLRIAGEPAGTRHWCMAFQHPVSQGIAADNVYGFVRQGGRLRQVLRVDVEHMDLATDATLQVDDGGKVPVKLQFGHNRFVVAAPQVINDTPVTVTARTARGTVMEGEVTLRPVQPYDYVPADWEPESVSKTLEYAYDDWCIARTAQRMGQPEEARRFYRRAGYYQNVFDPEVGFMRGRLSDGSWVTPFSPRMASHRQRAYTEGNAWQYTWFAPHDVQGLINLMGGRDAFVAKLDELFETTSQLEGEAPPDISGMLGQYAHGNEPSHHIAYLYAYAGAPWKTQERVRQIIASLYGTGPDGLPGNEDCGQMSAWYILSAIGFYPVNPADGTYVIGAPHFERVAIAVDNDKTFTVEAPGVSETNAYIQSATLNGSPLNRCYITHEEIAAGGILAFEMGPEPNTEWAADELAAPPSMTPP